MMDEETRRIVYGGPHLPDGLTEWRQRAAERAGNVVRRDMPKYIEKRLDNALVEPEVMSEQETRGWNNWLNAHLNELREEIIDAVADAIVDLRRERDAAIAQEVSRLKIEIAVLRGELKAMREQASHHSGLVDVGGNKLKRNGIDAHQAPGHYARAQQMVAHLIHQVNALVEEKAVLKRELARRTDELREIVASHQDERAAYNAHVAAIERTRTAESELLQIYRERAEGVLRGVAPRHVLH